MGPLGGIRVVELGGIGPGPFCGMILAGLGAEVIRIDRPAEAGYATRPVLHRDRRSIAIDLKRPAGVDAVLRLIGTADALIEGFRPGVTERLGLGPDVCLAGNPRLVYGRMTGWGQDGPLAQDPGHDLNYIAIGGALGTIGPAAGDPPVPLNVIGDMGGGGMLLALGIAAALVHVKTTGVGQVVDAAMTDGTALQLAVIHDLLASGRWKDEREANLLDGAAPFYRTYRCADGAHVAVGALEPQFYAALVATLGLSDDPLFADQHDRSAWPAMTHRLAGIFSSRPRDAWTAVFDGQNACVTPVLSLVEAARHRHNRARGTYLNDAAGAIQPTPAPRFTATPTAEPKAAPVIGAHTRDVLAELGLAEADIDALYAAGSVG